MKQARKLLRKLASPFFRRHPALARAYVLSATHPRTLIRLAGHCLGTIARQSSSPFASGIPATARSHDREDNLQAAADKLGRHLFEAHCRIVVFGPQTDAQAAGRRFQRIAGDIRSLHPAPYGDFPRLSRPPSRHAGPFPQPRLPPLRGGTRDALASRQPQRSAPRPCRRPSAGNLNRRRCFAADTTRARHRPSRQDASSAAEGKFSAPQPTTAAGTWPSSARPAWARRTLLHKLIASDIAAGRGLALIDPHGDLCRDNPDAVPPHRTNDVVLFDAGDRDFPLAYNPLSCPQPAQRPLVASGVVSAFKKLYGDSWGPRLEHILRNALLALLEVPGTSLLSLQRLLGDTSYRKMLTGRLSDPIVKAFWEGEFAHWKPQYRAEAIAPIQNKVGQFLSHPILRAIVGQSRRGLDLRRVLDDGLFLLPTSARARSARTDRVCSARSS